MGTVEIYQVCEYHQRIVMRLVINRFPHQKNITNDIDDEGEEIVLPRMPAGELDLMIPTILSPKNGRKTAMVNSTVFEDWYGLV